MVRRIVQLLNTIEKFRRDYNKKSGRKKGDLKSLKGRFLLTMKVLFVGIFPIKFQSLKGYQLTMFL